MFSPDLKYLEGLAPLRDTRRRRQAVSLSPHGRISLKVYHKPHGFFQLFEAPSSYFPASLRNRTKEAIFFLFLGI
jgi:hypothetical protein